MKAQTKMRRPDFLAKNSTGPSIWVFWIHPKTKELLAPYVEPVEQGQHDPDLHLIDSRMLHMNLWNTVKDHYPDLKHLKYDQVPRGRVFFNETNKKFHVFGPASHLADSNIANKIQNAYKLSKSQTVFDPNEDYELEDQG
jgi:hypothetical protein